MQVDCYIDHNIQMETDMLIAYSIATALAIHGPLLQHRQVAQVKAEPKVKLKAILPAEPVAQGEEILLELVISTDEAQEYFHAYSYFSQDFGIYIIGPWGYIEPAPIRGNPRKWLVLDGSRQIGIKVTKEKPYKMSVKLSEYFNLTDKSIFRTGKYQINVKFQSSTILAVDPVDSGPEYFVIEAKK